MLEVDLSAMGENAIYEIGDTLLTHKKQLENELRKQEETLFPQEHALLLYDLTNTYFEGGASKNTSAARGHSKEKRSDCPLVTLALVVDNRGFPIFSQIYKGNQSEPETLKEILKRLYVEDETLFKETLPTIVMDRGIATKNNLQLLKEKNYCPSDVASHKSISITQVVPSDTMTFKSSIVTVYISYSSSKVFAKRIG